MAASVSSYLEGLYAPVADERTDANLDVIGEIPRDLRGVFVQNSPNPGQPPSGRYHWFDGDGMVHGVELRDGSATYRNRWIQTAGLTREKQEGPLWKGIMEPITPVDGKPDKNTANTDLVYHNGKLLALWWLGGEPYELSVPELATVGPENYGGTLECGIAAHPKVDPTTGEMVFFDYGVYEGPWLTVGVVSAEGRVVHMEEIAMTGPRLFHDIAITRRHTVLLDLPMFWDEKALAAGKRRVGFDAEAPSRFGVMPRFGTSDDVKWFELPASYIYHTINAWEADDNAGNTVVHMTACRIENPYPTTRHTEEPDVPRLAFLRLDPYLHHYTFNLGTGQASVRQLDDVRTEFPRMNDALLGEKSRYAWHPRIAAEPTLLFDGVVRYDLDKDSSSAHTWGEQQFGGETVFVQRDGAQDEDDGYVLTFVTDRRDGTSQLVILDARNVGNELARVNLPRRVPVGFHAHWAPMVVS